MSNRSSTPPTVVSSNEDAGRVSRDGSNEEEREEEGRDAMSLEPSPTSEISSPHAFRPSSIAPHHLQQQREGRRGSSSSTATTVPDDVDALGRGDNPAPDNNNNNNNMYLLKVVSEFQAALCDRLISGTLETTASALVDAVHHLIRHREEMENSKEEERRSLESQVASAAVAIERLTSQIQEEKSRAHEQLRRLAARADGGDGSSRKEENEVQESLLADHARVLGDVELLRTDLDRSRGVCKKLRARLSGVLQENAELRRMLDMTKCEAVPRQQYQAEVRRCQQTQHALDVLRVESQTVEETYKVLWEAQEKMVRELEESNHRYQVQLELFTQQQQQHPLPSSGLSAEDAEAASARLQQQPNAVAMAMREMESQAQEKKLLLRIKMLEEEREARETQFQEALTAVAQKEEEAQRLSLDAQQLVFRNAVLSQQLVSALTRVDHLQRHARRLQQQLEEEETRAQRMYATAPWHSPALMEEVEVRRKQQQQQESDSRWGLRHHHRPPPPPPQTHLLQHKSAMEAVSMSASLLQQRDAQRKAGTTYHDERSLLFNSPLDVLLHHVEEGESDTTTAAATKASWRRGHVLGKVEVSGTLSQQLSAYLPEAVGGNTNSSSSSSSSNTGYTQRVRRLRNMAGGDESPVEFLLTLPVAPSLPACDQLSGVALSRPSTHCVLDPALGVTSVVGGGGLGGEISLPAASSVLNVTADDPQGEASPYYSLEPYAVNTVEALVTRNQELLRQLYLAANETNTRSVTTTMKKKSSESNSMMVQQDGIHGVEAVPSPEGRLSARRRVIESIGRTLHDDEKMGGGPRHPSGSTGLNQSTPSFSSSGGEEEEEEEEEGGGQVVSRRAGGSSLTGVVSSYDAMERVVNAAVKKHRLTQAKEEREKLSSTLVAVLREAQKQMSAQAHRDEQRVRTEGVDAMLLSLVDMCCSQAVQLAQKTLDEVVSHQESSSLSSSSSSSASQQCHQQVVQRLLGSLRDTLLAVCGVGAGGANASSPQQVEQNRAEERGGVACRRVEEKGGAGKHTRRSSAVSESSAPSLSPAAASLLVLEDTHVELLQQIAQLLRSASAKDDTLQQLLLFAQQQQKPILALLKEAQEKEEEQQQKEKKKRKRKSCRNHRTGRGEEDGGASRKRPRTPSQAMTSPTGMLSLYSPLMSNMPSPTGPMVPALSLSPSTAADNKEKKERQRRTRRALDGEGQEDEDKEALSATTSVPSCSCSLCSSGDEDDDGYAYREDAPRRLQRRPAFARVGDEDEEGGGAARLEERLALSHAAQHELGKELQSAKAEHLALLEQMWQLEMERDTATGEREALKEKLRLMVDPQEYERVKAAYEALELSTREQQEREAQAAVDRERLERRIDELEGEVSASSAVHAQGVADVQAKLTATESALAAHQEKEAARVEEERHREQQYVQWEESMAEKDALIQSLRDQVRGLAFKVSRCQIDFASHAAVQQALQDLYWSANDEEQQQVEEDNRRGEGGDHDEEEDHHHGTPAPAPLRRGASSSSSVFTLNAQLVAEMREERENLRRKVVHNQLDMKRLQDRVSALVQELSQAKDESQRAQWELMRLRASSQHQYYHHHDVSQQQENVSGEVGSSHNNNNNNNNTDEGMPSSSTTTIQRLQAELKTLRSELALLQERETHWKEEESRMKSLIHALSRDPVSETARKYGLQRCHSFEVQLGELYQSRLEVGEELQRMREKAAEAEARLEESKSSLESARDATQALQQQVTALQEQQKSLQEQVEMGSRELAEVRGVAAERETRLTQLQQELGAAREAGVDAESQIAEMKEDNMQLLARLEEMTQELKRLQQRELEASQRYRVAEENLAKAVASRASSGGGGFGGSSRSRHHRNPDAVSMVTAAFGGSNQ